LILENTGSSDEFCGMLTEYAANETFEKVAGVGLQANMILYLRNEYNLSNASGAYILSLWGAISYFMPILGAFISDSYLGRFSVIAYGTVISLLVSKFFIFLFLPYLFIAMINLKIVDCGLQYQ
jgi:dipeptide/tripeptide permease